MNTAPGSRIHGGDCSTPISENATNSGIHGKIEKPPCADDASVVDSIFRIHYTIHPSYRKGDESDTMNTAPGSGIHGGDCSTPISEMPRIQGFMAKLKNPMCR